jgi:cytochrome c2/mono/diheme cytochrome c family protein
MPFSRRAAHRCLVALWTSLLLLFGMLPAALAIEPEDLTPGLVATHRDAAKPTSVSVVRLEPQIALALKAGESPHPRLQAGPGRTTWEGYVNILRRGPYRFLVRIRGQFTLKVAGKEVLTADVSGEQPTLVESAAVQLEAGVHPLVAEFTRLAGLARVELFWEAPHFRREPLPYDHLGHLPDKTPPQLATDRQGERGRFLAEEASCVRCHPSGKDNPIVKGLAFHSGPDLSRAGQRLNADWLMNWLESPQKFRPGTAMPELFSADEDGRVERYAVAHYLLSLGGPVKPKTVRQGNPKDLAASRARGQRLFSSIGCIACHDSPVPEETTPPARGDAGRLSVFFAPPRTFSLTGLAQKTTPEQLTAYLQNPFTVNPGSRMPHMLLQAKEAEDLAHVLCQKEEGQPSDGPPGMPSIEQMLAAFQRVDPRADELTAFKRLRADQQWTDLGKRLVIDKGCNNCHTIAPGGKPFASLQASASLEDIRQPGKQDAGCLASKPEQRGKAPRFSFSDKDRAALKAFLNEGLTGAGSAAPTYAAHADMQRLNCLACHSRDGDGGLSPAMIEQLRRYENAENAEAVSPPPLTGVGHKLRTPWVRQVLLGAGRARPWMGLRMPQFGEVNVGRLPETLASLEGSEPDETIHKVALTAATIDAGRYLVGKNAFGCISCHDIAGVPNSGTRGPDLALMNQRVRHEWYLRWLEQPQRMSPGTRMPSVFADGKTLLDKVLDGKASTQAEAMWAYLSLGPTLPLPAGLEMPKGMNLVVENHPVLLRTFMPDAGSRAIAVGFPGGVSAAFDAHTCRLAYAWSGSFLDASPVWANRGGAPAKLLGPRVWSAPAGCPVGVTTSAEPPDFLNRAKDPAYGGSLPEGKLYDGPALLQFEGYATDKMGVPTFRYHLQTGPDEIVTIHERIEPKRAPVAVGVGRRFELHMPGDRTVWLLAGETSGVPRLLDGHGTSQALNLKADKIEVPVAGRMVVLPQDGDRVAVLALRAAPEGSQWRLERRDGRWQVLLRTPVPKAGEINVELNVWVPYRDEPGLLKELTSSR